MTTQAIIGMQMFSACHLDPAFVVRRTNYGSFSFAFVAVFQIASTDDWTVVMFTYVR